MDGRWGDCRSTMVGFSPEGLLFKGEGNCLIGKNRGGL